MSANDGYFESFQQYEYWEERDPDGARQNELGADGWKLSQVIKDKTGERWIYYRPLRTVPIYPGMELKAALPGEWHVGPAEIVVDASGAGIGGDTNGRRKHK